MYNPSTSSIFQSTLPRRERPPCEIDFISIYLFQSTLPRRERQPLSFYHNLFHVFQSTLPRRERLSPAFQGGLQSVFQSTLPRRERPFATTLGTTATGYFNPRSREGSDFSSLSSKVSFTTDFNPRSREGSDFCRQFSSSILLQFQSTLPRRERPVNVDYCNCNYHHFNPRSREGSDLFHISLDGEFYKFQSTLPRRERPQARADREQLSDISIHAPAKGATAKAEYLTRTFDISIHAPAKGATISRLPASFFLIHFNPRSREGSDRDLPKDMRLLSHISIHAPAKGATLAELEILPIAEEFQSTLPRRERHDANFDPVHFFDISIHAPAKGATDPERHSSGMVSVFQSTLPRRERPTRLFMCAFPGHFNPRSREGSDSKHTQFFRSNFRTKCAYLYFLLHYIFFTQNKQSYK